MLLYVITIFVVSGGWFRNCNIEDVAGFLCKCERLGEASGDMIVFNVDYTSIGSNSYDLYRCTNDCNICYLTFQCQYTLLHIMRKQFHGFLRFHFVGTLLPELLTFCLQPFHHE